METGKIYPMPWQIVRDHGKFRSMKRLILLTLVSAQAWSKPLVLLSYFDAFNGAAFNNSERIAHALATKLNSEASPFEIKLCALNTVFDKAYAQTEDCLKALPERPVMVIALGESTCQVKVESMMRNKDKTNGPDNAGEERNNSVIVPGAPEVLGMRYPLPQMYCALSSSERKDIDVSNNAGSFVCNNTAFQMSYHYPEVQYGFIHVPANNCSNLIKKSELAISLLEKMIIKGVNFLTTEEENPGLPHSSNELRLPTSKSAIRSLRRNFENKDACIHEYLKRSKAADEGGRFLGLMN